MNTIRSPLNRHSALTTGASAMCFPTGNAYCACNNHDTWAGDSNDGIRTALRLASRRRNRDQMILTFPQTAVGPEERELHLSIEAGQESQPP